MVSAVIVESFFFIVFQLLFMDLLSGRARRVQSRLPVILFAHLSSPQPETFSPQLEEEKMHGFGVLVTPSHLRI